MTISKGKLRVLLLLIVTFLEVSLVFSSSQFTATDLHQMIRTSSLTLSPDGKYLVFSSRKWNKETGKVSTNLQYTDLTGTLKNIDITKPVEGQTDSNPYFSLAFPDKLFFLRGGQIHTIDFPPTESSEEKQLTSYAISVKNFKIVKNTMIFSSDVYFDCEDLRCSHEKIANETKATYQTYDSLFMFYWDKWVPNGKGSHLFYQKVETLTKDPPAPVDITYGMEINAPFIDADNSDYDISPDGTSVAFSGHLRNSEEARSTSWKTYYMDLTEMTRPYLFTTHNEGRTQAPRFSLDGTKIAYLAMKTPMLESENSHFEIYNILTNKVDVISIENIDKSVNDYIWLNDNEIIFQATVLGVNKLFKVNFLDVANPKYTLLEVASSSLSYSVPIRALKKKTTFVAKKVGYDHPEVAVLINFKSNPVQETIVLNPNENVKSNFELSEPEMFTFQGGNGDIVQGWLLRPINFEPENKKYPVALLIHGGPESSWTSDWSYRWNPQIWTNAGYVVVMINPHGSTGVNTPFLEAVRNDWGGLPYKDIMLGIEYVFANYKFADRDNACAAGGSYGGYMINWIEGHDNIFKCLVNHDGGFSIISKFYSADLIFFQQTEFCEKDKTPCNPFDSKEARKEFEKHSPERLVNNWKTPMLIVHGGKDYRVPLTEALSTFSALNLKGVEAKFIYFPMENHWVLNAENSIKWNEEIIAWMDHYTKPPMNN